MEKSSLKLVSNIMLKSEFEKNHNAYLPYDLLSKESRDSRLSGRLSKFQEEQKIKGMFIATEFIREDSDDLESENQ